MRTAINLPDIPVNQIKRGDVVTVPGLGGPGSTLVVLLEKSPRLDREDHAVAQPLKNGSFVYVHHGTSRVTAKIAFPEKRPLGAGQKKIAQLKLASPMFAFVGDHFVVRDSSEQCTIAGGIVLNPDGDRESLTSTAASYDVDSLARLMISQRGFAQPENLLSK